MKLRKLVLAIFSVSIFSHLFAAPVKVEDLKPATNLPKDRPSVALVLAGGGAKGFAELPIMEYIDQLDIPIDMIVGASVGAIVGGFYSAGYTALEMVNEFSHVDWTPYFTDAEASPYESVYGIHGKTENMMSINFDDHFNMRLGTAVSNGQLAYQLFRKMLIRYPSNMSFDELPIPFRAVATDMLTGDALVLQDGDLAEAIRASMSLPGVFEPMNFDGYYFTDGGIRYNLPINVAKAMGYDIIIAIDVSATVLNDPDSYTNPAVSLLNALTISEHANTLPLLDQADLIIVPNYKGFTTMDFSKSKEIYEQGKTNLDEYKEPLENIRRRIYPEDYDKDGNRISSYREIKDKGIYHDRDLMVPESLICEGAVLKDLRFINDAFEKIQGKELSTSAYDDFMNILYLTGNYNSIRTRIISNGETEVINLQMRQRPEKEFKLLLNTTIEQTFSDSSTTRANIEMDLQARGYSDIGSMISLHGTILNDLKLEGYYMQPFNPYLFMEYVIGGGSDIYRQKASDAITFSSVQSSSKFYTQINFGIRTPNGNLAKIGTSYNAVFPTYQTYLDSDDPFFKETVSLDTTDLQKRIFGSYAGLTFHTDVGKLNSKVYPTKGYNISPNLKFFLPFGTGESYAPIFMGDITFRFAFPITRHLSFNSSLKAGMDFSETMKEYYQILPYEGFSFYDRIYFPSITSKNYFGTNMLAVKWAFQYKPKERLSILGGELLFRFETTVGVVNYDWNQTFSGFNNPDTLYPIVWSSTVGIAVKGNNNFNALLRVGLCSTYKNRHAFLLCFDLGNTLF